MGIRIKAATKRAAGLGIDLGVLTKEAGIEDGRNLGGKFRLPAEFDSRTMASGFYKKGSEVDGKKQREIISGTAYSADGWIVWEFPDGPEKGKPYEVSSDGATYVLMCRAKEVQEAVNYIHGEHSRDRMDSEVRGETAAGQSVDDTGVLTSDRLSHDPAMRAEQQREQEAGRNVSTFEGQRARPRTTVITKKKIKLRK